jgi:predicted RNA methylase
MDYTTCGKRLTYLLENSIINHFLLLLARILSQVALEQQYPTSAHLTACVVQLATENGDLGSGRSCGDLGCGTGMLSIGAAFVRHVA